MIVPAMNEKEIESEIKKDFAQICKSTIPRLAIEYDRERRKNKIDKSSDYNKLYSIKTAGKNQWMIFIKKATDKPKYKHGADGTFFCVVYFYTKQGLNVCRLCDLDGDLEFFYGHFFKRYNERQQLNLPNTLSAVKHFFTMNESFRSLLSHVKKEIAQPGTVFAESVCDEGLALGVHYIGTSRTVYKTFISRHLLTKSQRSVEEILDEEFDENTIVDPYTETNNVAA
ncbi:MAG: hypothetical protein JWQ96_1951 [Segetibacter sp.]|nr:hypothetical protein [Segetibacter sp.]